MVHLNDPIGDLVTRMRNAQRSRKNSCRAPLSRIKWQLCEVMKKEGWLEDVRVVGESPKQEIEVVFSKDRPGLTLKRVSTPGQRIYRQAAELKPVLQGFGTAIVTTSQGLMTDKEARQKKIGGEVLCTIS